MSAEDRSLRRAEPPILISPIREPSAIGRDDVQPTALVVVEHVARLLAQRVERELRRIDLGALRHRVVRAVLVRHVVREVHAALPEQQRQRLRPIFARARDLRRVVEREAVAEQVLAAELDGALRLRYGAKAQLLVHARAGHDTVIRRRSAHTCPTRSSRASRSAAHRRRSRE